MTVERKGVGATANAVQVGGTHYAGGKFQHWDWTARHLDNRYMEGSISAYVLRHRDKGGVADLDKAAHYIRKLMELYVNGEIEPIGKDVVPNSGSYAEDTQHLFAAHNATLRVRNFIYLLACWKSYNDLEELRARLELIREETQAAEAGAGYVDQG